MPSILIGGDELGWGGVVTRMALEKFLYIIA